MSYLGHLIANTAECVLNLSFWLEAMTNVLNVILEDFKD